VLDQIGHQIYELGYRHVKAGSLQRKHVEGLAERWKVQCLAVGRIRH
jgi:hypothetical protein